MGIKVSQESLPYWIGFSKVPGIGPARLQTLLDYYGQIDLAWQANPGELRAIGLDKRSVENLVKVRNTLDLEAELTKLEKLNVTVLTWDSPDYPDRCNPGSRLQFSGPRSTLPVLKNQCRSSRENGEADS